MRILACYYMHFMVKKDTGYKKTRLLKSFVNIDIAAFKGVHVVGHPMVGGPQNCLSTYAHLI